nr:hypothetical protein [Tanacetum cinerariifolium]
MRNNVFIHGIKNDSVLEVLKFVSKYEENQVYRKPIPDVMLSKEVMETKAYKTYLAFATGNAVPEKARKRITTHITPMKESSLTTGDNIISKYPDAALELAKSISRTKADDQVATRLVHETHERRVTEKPTESRRHTDDEQYVRTNEELYDNVNVEMKDVEPADEGKCDEEMTDIEKAYAKHEEINQEDENSQVQDEVQETTTASPTTQKEKTDVPPSSSSRFVSSNYAVYEYLGSSLGDALQKELQKHIEELRQEYSQKSTLKIWKCSVLDLDW